MGSIRQTYIKRVAIDLIRHYPESFNGDFAHNKEKVLELTDLRVDVNGTPTVVYKKLANRIAGYATRYVKAPARHVEGARARVPGLSSPTLVDFLEAERERRGWVGQVRRLRGARLLTNARYRRLMWANQILVGTTEPPVDWQEIQAQAEPTFRSLGVKGRRVMLFGDEVRRRLEGPSSVDGFRERTLWLLAFRGLTSAQPNPRVMIRLVDPFLRPAWFTLSYRVEQETARPGESVSDWASFYSSLAERTSPPDLCGFSGRYHGGSRWTSRRFALSRLD